MITTKEIPKIVLHLHLDGSVDITTMYQWLQEDGYNYSIEQVKKLVQVDQSCRDLNEYLTKFSLPCQLLQTKERLETATYLLFKKLSLENVIYAEVRFAPSKHLSLGLSYDEVVTAVINGMSKAKKRYQIEGGILLCCMRDNTYFDNMKTIDIAKKYLNKGVCGIDLAGSEAIYPTENFKHIFYYAKKLHIPFTIHAGEAAGSDSIMSVLNFGTTRLGHGVKCIDNKMLMDKILEKKVLLEICVISNYQTEAIKEKHPIEDLYCYGIKVSINTDNDTVSNTNIVDEYNYILSTTNMNIEDLIKCNYDSISYIFAEEKIKEKLYQEFKKIM